MPVRKEPPRSTSAFVSAKELTPPNLTVSWDNQVPQKCASCSLPVNST